MCWRPLSPTPPPYLRHHQLFLLLTHVSIVQLLPHQHLQSTARWWLGHCNAWCLFVTVGDLGGVGGGQRRKGKQRAPTNGRLTFPSALRRILVTVPNDPFPMASNTSYSSQEERNAAASDAPDAAEAPSPAIAVLCWRQQLQKKEGAGKSQCSSSRWVLPHAVGRAEAVGAQPSPSHRAPCLGRSTAFAHASATDGQVSMGPLLDWDHGAPFEIQTWEPCNRCPCHPAHPAATTNPFASLAAACCMQCI